MKKFVIISGLCLVLALLFISGCSFTGKSIEANNVLESQESLEEEVQQEVEEVVAIEDNAYITREINDYEITYKMYNCPETCGVTIEEEMIGNCSFPSGKKDYKTVMLSEGNLEKTIKIIGFGECLIKGDYQFAYSEGVGEVKDLDDEMVEFIDSYDKKDYSKCYGGDVWWYDSDDERSIIKESCEYGCDNRECEENPYACDISTDDCLNRAIVGPIDYCYEYPDYMNIRWECQYEVARRTTTRQLCYPIPNEDLKEKCFRAFEDPDFDVFVPYDNIKACIDEDVTSFIEVSSNNMFWTECLIKEYYAIDGPSYLNDGIEFDLGLEDYFQSGVLYEKDIQPTAVSYKITCKNKENLCTYYDYETVKTETVFIRWSEDYC